MTIHFRIRMTALLLGLSQGLFAMEQNVLTHDEIEKARREAASKTEELRQQIIVRQLTAQRLTAGSARGLAPVFKIPYIKWSKVALRVGPILAEYFSQADKAKNVEPDSKGKKKKKPQVGMDDIITGLIECIRFDKISLKKMVQISEGGIPEEDQDHLVVGTEFFATDVFDERKLKQCLTNFIIEVKNFWIVVSEGAATSAINTDLTVPGEDELSYIAALFEKAKEHWASRKSKLIMHYNSFVQSVDSDKIAKLEKEHGKIDLTAYFSDLKAMIENFLGIAAAHPSKKSELKFSVIPIIGEHLEKFLRAEAVFDLLRIIDSVETIAKLNQEIVIKKALDCIKFEVFFQSNKDDKEQLDAEIIKMRAAKEEGCRVLLKLLFEIHSKREEAASSAVNRLLLILGEHSLQEKQKQQEAQSAQSKAAVENNNNMPTASFARADDGKK